MCNTGTARKQFDSNTERGVNTASFIMCNMVNLFCQTMSNLFDKKPMKIAIF